MDVSLSVIFLITCRVTLSDLCSQILFDYVSKLVKGTIVMGCRSTSKCNAAAKLINDEIASSGTSSGKAIAMNVDLASFESVRAFASKLQGIKIDVLFNNAGYVPVGKLPVNEYGLDAPFTSMHLSHFLLTEEMFKQNSSMRVVTTSSAASHFCVMPFNFPTILLNALQHAPLPEFVRVAFSLTQGPGCVDEDYLHNKVTKEVDDTAYMRAKMANMMHAVEIPKRHPQSTSVAIDLGFVGTHILSFMKGGLAPESIGLMRNAKLGCLPMIHAILSSDEELLEGNFKSGREWLDGGIAINTFGITGEPFSYIWYRDFVNLGRSRMLDLSHELWKASASIISKYAPVMTNKKEGD